MEQNHTKKKESYKKNWAFKFYYYSLKIKSWSVNKNNDKKMNFLNIGTQSLFG